MFLVAVILGAQAQNNSTNATATLTTNATATLTTSFVNVFVSTTSIAVGRKFVILANRVFYALISVFNN